MFGAGLVTFIMLEVKLVNIRWPGGRKRVGNGQVPTALVGANAALHARFHTSSLPHLNRRPVASESRLLSILRVLGCQMIRWHHALLNLVRDRSPGCIGKTRQSLQRVQTHLNRLVSRRYYGGKHPRCSSRDWPSGVPVAMTRYVSLLLSPSMPFLSLVRHRK